MTLYLLAFKSNQARKTRSEQGNSRRNRHRGWRCEEAMLHTTRATRPAPLGAIL